MESEEKDVHIQVSSGQLIQVSSGQLMYALMSQLHIIFLELLWLIHHTNNFQPLCQQWSSAHLWAKLEPQIVVVRM